MIAMRVIQGMAIQISQRIVSLVIREIIIKQQTPITWPLIYPPLVWNAILPCQDGNPPNSKYMTPSFFLYSQESTGVNGTVAPNAIAARPTILFLPVSIATSTTALTWMTNIRVRLIMHIPAWHVWIATQPGMKSNYHLIPLIWIIKPNSMNNFKSSGSCWLYTRAKRRIFLKTDNSKAENRND